MTRRWVRVYADILDDQKVAKMSAKSFKFFIFLLVFCAESGIGDKILDAAGSICWRFRVTKKAFNDAVKELSSLGIITLKNNDIIINKWDKRQYKSDNSTERVQRYRNKHETLHVTPPDTDTDTETDKDTDTHTTEIDVSSMYRHYKKYAKQFYSNYPMQKNEEDAINAFVAICNSSRFTENQTQEFFSLCVFAIQNQRHEKEALARYKLPVPEWKYPDTWLQKKCWLEKVETASAIKRRAVEYGRYKETTEEIFENPNEDKTS